MSLVLSPATLADVPALTNIYMVTFTESLFPRTPSVREWTNEKQIKSMAEDKRARFITITEDGQITAYAKWLMPTNEKDDSDDPSQVPSWPEGVGRDFDDFHLALARKRKELMGERPYYRQSDQSPHQILSA